MSTMKPRLTYLNNLQFNHKIKTKNSHKYFSIGINIFFIIIIVSIIYFLVNRYHKKIYKRKNII